MTDGKQAIAASVFFARLGQRLIHLLTALTRAGLLYEVDMRLRPDGAAGMLVSSLKSFIQYQQDKAWTWEHQPWYEPVLWPEILRLVNSFW